MVDCCLDRGLQTSGGEVKVGALGRDVLCYMLCEQRRCVFAAMFSDVWVEFAVSHCV